MEVGEAFFHRAASVQPWGDDGRGRWQGHAKLKTEKLGDCIFL